MNADQLKGKWMQFKGELKQQYGKFTDDDLQQTEGNYDTFLGKVQEWYGDKKDALMTWADQWHEQSAQRYNGSSALHSGWRWLPIPSPLHPHFDHLEGGSACVRVLRIGI
jgi:uncharacterized protein YjbJ (UPF0337 family)